MQHKTLTFGAFTLDTGRGALMKGDAELRLRPKSFEVLRFLVENAGRLVTKDEIFAAVWGETVVTDDSLTQCLIDIRRAIGDEKHELVRTVPRRGYIFDIPVSATGPQAVEGAVTVPRPSAAARQLAWAGVAVALVAAAVGLWAAFVDRAGDLPRGAPSIAVLPFVDLSDAQDQQLFAEGLSDEILNALAQSLDMRVIARTSSFAFRDRQDMDIAAIAERLGVTHVLEGSVRKSGDRVRITAQLVDAADSTHLWSQTYDREIGDLLFVQAEIADQIAATLHVRMARHAPAAVARKVDPEAHGHFLQGRFLHNRRMPGDLAAAEEHFRAALAIDDQYAPAWAALAGTLLVRIFEDGSKPGVALEQMREAVTRALESDPSLPEAQLRAAHYYSQVGDSPRAERHRRQAVALAPDDPLILGTRVAHAIRFGDFGLALQLQRRAVELDPLNAVARGNLAMEFMRAGEYEEAGRELARSRELSPLRSDLDLMEAELLILRGSFAEALVAAQRLPAAADRDQLLALAYYGLGRNADAEAAMERLRGLGDAELPLRLAEIHAQRGETDEAFALLPAARNAVMAAALTPGARSQAFNLPTSLFIQPLRSDPRWSEIISSDEQFP